ncbi:MAG: hypothetical protein KH120_04545 [Eubacterium sp.]|jgi:hypothetical protein|nr:hypothetical protein [Eubacterium sp.]DAN88734.1 MAG TPA: hypothetical protein [Caudoviricetes sp.]
MKVLKSFMYKNIGATQGDDINISDDELASALISKKLIEPDKVIKKKNIQVSEQKSEGDSNAKNDKG